MKDNINSQASHLTGGSTQAGTHPAQSNHPQTRRYKVRGVYWRYQLSTPWYSREHIGEIQLKGKWIIAAGFEINSYVAVTISQGRIIIEPEKTSVVTSATITTHL